MRRTAWVCLTVAALVATGFADDWPQWRGPNRDGKSAETGLLKSWPEGGPKRLWTATENLGAGFSTVSVADGTIYTTGAINKEGWLFAFDLDGTLKWKVKYGPEFPKFPPATRTTPTVDDGRLYLMSGMGLIACFDAKTGERKWAVDTAAKVGGKNIRWGIAESPLIHGSKVYCTPGGPDATMVALDKMTGETIWTTKGLSDRSAYVSPLLIEDDQKSLIVTVTESNIIGVRSRDGKVLWKHPYRGQCQAHINTPLYHDGQVYITSGYDAGGVMMKLSPDGETCEILWKDKTLDTHHGGVLLIDGHIYGSSWRGNGNGNWVCLDWKTGAVKYDHHWNNKGSVTFAEGMLYCYEEKGGTVALVKADPSGFHVVSSFRVAHGNGQHWGHPVIANGRLYIRHGNALACYDIKAP